MPWSTPPTFTPGQVVTATDLNTYLRDNTNYLLTRIGQIVQRNNTSDYTTTSTSFVDIDTTNLTITLTVSGSAVLLILTGSVLPQTTKYAYFDFTVDGVRYGAGGKGLWTAYSIGSAQQEDGVSVVVLVTGLTSGSHIFRPQWKVDGGTGTLRATSAGNEVAFCVQEVG